MIRSFRSLVVASSCLALATIASSHVALASVFEVSPVTLTLTSQATSGLVAIRNQGTEAMRVQVAAFEWNQSPLGEMVLAPTTDLIFFPSLLAISPGETRNIRIGGVPAFGAEKSYRVFVEELPPLHRDSATGVRVLTRMGIPVFTRATEGVPYPKVESIHVEGHNATFAVADAGDAHFVTKNVSFVAKDDSDNPVFETHLTGWYVLARGRREYELDLPPAACAKIRSVVVTAETSVGSTTSRADTRCSG